MTVVLVLHTLLVITFTIRILLRDDLSPRGGWPGLLFLTSYLTLVAPFISFLAKPIWVTVQKNDTKKYLKRYVLKPLGLWGKRPVRRS